MHDLVIRRGQVVDGTGSEPIVADIAIDGGLITEVGDVGAARQTIDADADEAGRPVAILRRQRPGQPVVPEFA